MGTGIEEYINSIIELTKNNTIIFTELEIEHDHVEIEGEVCGPLEKREFFYLAPPCYLNGKRLIAVTFLEKGLVIPYFHGDEEELYNSLYTTLLSYAIVKSFTIYQIYIDRFMNDDNANYILTNEDNIYVATMLYYNLTGISDANMGILNFVPFVAIKLTPYTNTLPKYSILQVNGGHLNVLAIDKDKFKQILYENYDNTKKSMQYVLKDNEKLAQLIDQLDVY